VSDADTPIVNILGERVALGPMPRDHLALHLHWLNDFATERLQGATPEPQTPEVQQRWYERHVLGRDDVAWFSIYLRDTWRVIGWTELKDIDYRHRTAEFAIMIGPPECRGRGCGTETARLMLDYAFTTLGLHSVWLETYAFNPAAIRAYTKAGFREVGRRREAQLMGGRLWDVVYMDCLAAESTSDTG
jgi:RimJ/RimL family protein N-acetyltransferase